MEQIDEKTVAQLRDQSRKSLFFFARAILGFVDLDKHIHLPLCRMLENYQENTRRLVVLPRTWFKSTIASIAYPIWRAINNSNIRLLIAQNTMTNAKKKVGSIKTIFETSELLQALFPELMPRGDRPWSSECLTVNRSLAAPEGTFEPAGTGTAIISRHFDEVIEDDTVAPDYDAMTGEIQQPTNNEIEKAIGFHKMCYPLLLHPLKSVRTVIGTRWAPQDLIGWILKNAPGYKIYSRSAREKNNLPATEEMGGKPIWDRFNEKVLTELSGPQGVGPFMFDTLYMNSPTLSVNQVFKRDYIEYYNTLPQGLLYCTSVDPAPSDSQAKTIDADFNVVLTTAVRPSTGDVWIVYYNRERCDPGELIDMLFSHNRAYKPLASIIETYAYQRTLMYWVRKKQEQLNERFYIEEVPQTRASKSARILGLQPWFAAHKIMMRHEHGDLERELLCFDPNRKSGGHDDIIDALSMQISFWSKVCETHQKEASTEERADPLAGGAIIDELLDRASLEHQYPYDIGHMAERAQDLLPRNDLVYLGRGN